MKSAINQHSALPLVSSRLIGLDLLDIHKDSLASSVNWVPIGINVAELGKEVFIIPYSK